MRWGVTERLPLPGALEQVAKVHAEGGCVIQIVYVGTAKASQIVGGNPQVMEMFRVFFSLPPENGNGETSESAIMRRLPDGQ